MDMTLASDLVRPSSVRPVEKSLLHMVPMKAIPTLFDCRSIPLWRVCVCVYVCVHGGELEEDKSTSNIIVNTLIDP